MTVMQNPFLASSVHSPLLSLSPQTALILPAAKKGGGGGLAKAFLMLVRE